MLDAITYYTYVPWWQWLILVSVCFFYYWILYPTRIDEESEKMKMWRILADLNKTEWPGPR